ncbi:MAG: 50S ribosomal protein L11 methyltransferase [Bacteroidetes bacterium]|nr:MAG: 50S ribosomal protein L11 methyltransferase [Bacteroidota bacterium]
MLTNRLSEGVSHFEFEIPVKTWNKSEKEILLARMSVIGFDGFVETEDLIQAYIPTAAYSAEAFNGIVDEMALMGLRLQYRYHETPDQNWNEEWEKKFDPVCIHEKVLIRAPFHADTDDLPLTIVIEPKMSFGTGHHYTTRLMIMEMLELDLKGRHVLDMGCGTGVLGIFALMRGAESVLGIDNDQWAYENALENVSRNGADAMEVRLGDASSLGDEQFSLILANITRNTLVRDLPLYAGHLLARGHLVMSGVLAEDALYVLNAAYDADLQHMNTREESGWISLSFVKP